MTAPSLQEDLARLDAIVRALEANDLDLDRALRTARERLSAAELRLRQLREAADGSVRLDDVPG